MIDSTPAAVPRVGFERFAPLVFVLLWSTGFIGAKLGLPYAEPFTFLLLRFIIVTAIMAVVALVLRAPWPRTWAQVGHCAVVGILLQGFYLGGVFSAIHLGMSAGISSLIVGLQPLLISFFGQVLLRERVTGRQWLGLALGLAGAALVLGEPFISGASASVSAPPLAIVAAVLALLGSTFGTLYQRRFGRDIPLLTGTNIQFVASGILAAILAFSFETMRIEWTPSFVFALGWLVMVLSCGATLLLMLLIRRTTAARVSSLFYLVPPATAVEAFLLFNERLGVLALVGLAMAAAGVALVLADGK